MSSVNEIKAALSDILAGWEEKNARRLYARIEPKNIVQAAKRLYSGLGMRLSTASGTDTRENIEILYHFSDDSSGIMVSLRVLLKDKINPQIDSITKIFTAASWIEREIHELLGVNFTGHPNLKTLLLPEDWPKNSYPLRRDLKENTKLVEND